MKLSVWGWNQALENDFEQFRARGLTPARVVHESHHIYLVESEMGRKTARVSGAFAYRAAVRSDYPTIGDWVAVRAGGAEAVIEAVCKRKSQFSRKAAGIETEEQIIAANLDRIFLVFALDGGRSLTPGGLERYLTLAWNSGAEPQVILNKADLCDDIQGAVLRTEASARGVEIHLVSAVTDQGIRELNNTLKPGITIALVGPSGVGKSSLINALCGQRRQKTGSIRTTDKKGRHITTHKELLLLPSGTMLIDTPGLRELQLWGDDNSADDVFQEITELATSCRYRDCSHQGEPGCAVQQALAEGSLEYPRFENYLDLKKELGYLARRKNEQYLRLEKKRWKNIAKFAKQYYKNSR